MNLPKQFLNLTYKPLVKRYLLRERNFESDGIRVKVFPGVFHPGLFFSTRILLSYLKQFTLAGKKVLELGAGTGLISIFCFRKGAISTASDISVNAIRNIQENQRLCNAEFQVIESDLFDRIPSQHFDFIIINPPYYKGKVNSESDYAWYSGENHEYFMKLFSQLPEYIHDSSRVLMILSDACDIQKIESMAGQNKLSMRAVYEKSNWLEINRIYQITKN